MQCIRVQGAKSQPKNIFGGTLEILLYVACLKGLKIKTIVLREATYVDQFAHLFSIEHNEIGVNLCRQSCLTM